MRLALVAQIEDGSGMRLLMDVGRVLLAPLDEVGFWSWEHPAPIVQAHQVEAGMEQAAERAEEARQDCCG